MAYRRRVPISARLLSNFEQNVEAFIESLHVLFVGVSSNGYCHSFNVIVAKLNEGYCAKHGYYFPDLST